MPTIRTSSDPTGYEQRRIGVGLGKRLPTGASLQFDVSADRYGTGGGELRDNGYSFTLSQPLLRGAGITATADLTDAKRATISAARSYSDARRQLVVTVADTYFAAMRGTRLVEAAERSMDRAMKLRISSAARAKVGLATELDVLRADLLSSQAEAELIAQRESVATALDALKLLIGRAPDSDVQLAEGAHATPLDQVAAIRSDVSCVGGSDASVAPLIQTALAARLDVREARDRIADRRRAQTVARWNLLPPVNLDVSYTRRGVGAASAPLFGELFNGWRVELSTSYALDRSDESAAAAAASISVRAAEQAAADTERHAAEEVRRACRASVRAARSIDIQSKAVLVAERQLRLAQIRYERGIADNFDVVDAESNLFQAQSALVDAQVDHALAGLNVQRLTGTLDPDQFAR